MPEKKRYFKKEKKHLKPTRHKAPPGTKSVKKQPQKQQNSLKKLQFPKIPRVITEGWKKFEKKVAEFEKKSGKYHKVIFNQKLLLTILGLLVLLAGFVGWQTYREWRNWQDVSQNKKTLEHQLIVWEDTIKQYPTYRDAYFEAAILAYRLGERGKTQTYLQQVLTLDPNFKPAFVLEKLNR